MMLTLGGAIVGAALWFCYLQLFVLHAFCKYCTLLHVLGLGLAGWILFAGRPLNLSKGRLGWFAAGLVSAALFAFVQSRTLPAAAYDTGRAEAALPTFSEGEVPVLGPSDASEELTLLFDFQCIHCRRLHPLLPELLEKAGGQYRIRLCPVPLSSACNPYIPATGVDRFAGSCQLTRYALAVWYVRPEAAGAFWEYLLGDGDEHAPIAPAEAETRAQALLGADFAAAVMDPRIDAYLRKVEELFGRTSSGEKSGVPRIIHGQRWLVPETDRPDALLDLIRSELITQ
jgi:protein-disulfide isomerase